MANSAEELLLRITGDASGGVQALNDTAVAAQNIQAAIVRTIFQRGERRYGHDVHRPVGGFDSWRRRYGVSRSAPPPRIAGSHTR
jgi:hypothetical protein